MEQICVLAKGATMKKEIQPNYVEVKFVCACGAEFAGKTSKPSHPYRPGSMCIWNSGCRGWTGLPAAWLERPDGRVDWSSGPYPWLPQLL